MTVYFRSGKPQGVGISGRGPDGQVREIQGSVYEQPRKRWTDPVTARRVPSKWKGEQREQGEQGVQGDNHVHNLSTLCI
jgi:hypothetical protein